MFLKKEIKENRTHGDDDKEEEEEEENRCLENFHENYE